VLDLIYIHFGHERHSIRYGIELGSRWLVDMGIRCRGLAVLDRPTKDVRGILNEAHPEYWLDIIEIDRRQLAPDFNGQVIASRDLAMRRLHEIGEDTKWVCFLDDDIQYGPRWRAHIKKALSDDRILAWRGVSLFLWNSWSIINLKQEHRVTHFFRYRPGSRMRPDLVLHHTGDIHEELEAEPERAQTLPWFLLDLSGICAQARREMYEAQLRAGKYDPFTFRWIESPDPIALNQVINEDPEEFWRKRYGR